VHRNHHEEENFIEGILSIFFPQLRMVFMNGFIGGWVPNPIHQRERGHEEYGFHDVGGHIE
jgi:hypothetical protein